MSADDAAPLRLSMTLPGSASLGAFQAGATAALAVTITTLRSAGHQVHVDAIGGSSAGSIVAMLFAHSLLTGRDAASFLAHAWVDEVDIELLRDGSSDAPLGFDDLRSQLVAFLDDEDEHPQQVNEPLDSPIELQVGLTSLLGYEIPTATPTGTESSLSFADWASHVLTPTGGRGELVEPEGASLLDAVLTSASHPLAVRPRTLDRSADRDAIVGRGIENLPDDATSWFTDGGLVESEPVGRIVRAARRRSGSAAGRRVHLIVDPRSSGPSGDPTWGDAEADKSWLEGLRRAISVVPTQALHDDIRAVTDTNRRLDALDETVEWLATESSIDSGELRRRLAEFADLDGKEHVDLEMITPLRYLDAHGGADGVTDVLAGDFIGAFGGFLDRRIRRSDFALGWKSTRAWVDAGLGDRDVGGEEIDAVLESLDGHPVADWRQPISDGDGIDQLDRSGRWQLVLLALQFARVGVRAAVPTPSFVERLRNR